MKYKILSAVVATALLNGCVDGSDPSTTVQAYDPGISNMQTRYECTDEPMDSAGLTNDEGNAVISNTTFALNTSTCELFFDGTEDSIDVFTGDDMSDLNLKVPRGMANNGQKVTGSAASTYIYDELGGADYNDETARLVLTALGLGDLLNNNSDIDIRDLLLDPEAASKKLGDDTPRFLATFSAASYAIKFGGSVATAKAFADAIIAQNPDYPVSATSDKNVYFPFSQADVDSAEAGNPVVLPAEKDAVVQDSETPATGGTGGTGATGGEGGSGI